MESKMDPMITVCDKCLMAACWRGIFLCEEARDAGIVQKPRSELEKLGREHSCYWDSPKHHKALTLPQPTGVPDLRVAVAREICRFAQEPGESWENTAQDLYLAEADRILALLPVRPAGDGKKEEGEPASPVASRQRRPMKLRVDVVERTSKFSHLIVQQGDEAGFSVSAPPSIIREAAYRLNAFESPSPATRGPAEGPSESECQVCGGKPWRGLTKNYGGNCPSCGLIHEILTPPTPGTSEGEKKFSAKSAEEFSAKLDAEMKAAEPVFTVTIPRWVADVASGVMSQVVNPVFSVREAHRRLGEVLAAPIPTALQPAPGGEVEREAAAWRAYIDAKNRAKIEAATHVEAKPDLEKLLAEAIQGSEVSPEVADAIRQALAPKPEGKEPI
jgi:hypothetical protein